MKLTAIEMQGFKSFPDRIKLSFDEGITAVVGPNGSGKSNISDAIKWVFGEQSSKSLRGNKMEDVIFNGSQGSKARKPMGFAWVSLYIDNKDRQLDVDSDEVIIMRKLYRSGESEYRINGNMVRLRDINEIFMDTGLGRDGYSIIEQGRIAEIVSSKSTQRREIFEEAAGISRFRYRKNEAEKKLAQAEENLVRLRDIMGELEGRVEPLRVQSEKAQKFIVYAQEKKTLEVSLWLRSLDKLKKQMKELDDRLLIAASDRNAAQSRLDAIENRINEIYESSQRSAVYIEKKRAETKTIEEEIAACATDTAVKENDFKRNLEAIKAIENELAQREATGGELDEQIARKEAFKNDAENKMSVLRKEAEALAGNNDARRKEMQRLELAIEALEEQKREIEEKISKANMTSETSSTLINETVLRLEALREQTLRKDEELSALKEQLKKAEEQVEEIKEELNGLTNSKNGYAIKLESRREKLTRLENEQKAYEKAAGECLQKAQLLLDMEKNLEGFGHAVKYVMKQSSAGNLKGIVGPVSSLIKVDQTYTTAIEIALGSAMQNIVTADEQSAKRAMQMLKNAKEGRATFMPVSNITGRPIQESSLKGQKGFLGIASELVECADTYRNIIDYVLGRTVIADDIDSAADIAKHYSYKYRVVTLDGQVVNAGGSLTGGYVNTSANVLGRKNQIEMLREQAAEFTAQSDKAEEKLDGYRREAASISAVIDGIDSEYRTGNENLIFASAEVKRLSMSLAEADQRGEASLAEYDAMSKRIEELRSQNLSSSQLAEKLTANSAELSEKIALYRQEHAECAAQTEQTDSEIAEKHMELAMLDKDINAVTELLDGLFAQKQDREEYRARQQASIEQLNEANLDIGTQIEQFALKTESGKKEILRISEAIEKEQQYRDTLESESVGLRQEEKRLTAQREEISGNLVRLEEHRKSLNESFDGIVGQLWDQYELTRSQAQDTAIEIENIQAADKRLAELKGKIRALGTVNVAAIEEYSQVNERYTFMKSQIDDVESSKSQLTKLIGELSSEMSDIFLEKFRLINKHFSVIFTELFGGGTGRLALTDEKDPLNTGIEIFVQPPGKIIKNLSSLSGGEQAYVAICVYFAILKVNPSPFVLVDEIESALDDVNIARFAGYMRKMTENTQFIAITHRRGTMEEADVLYGITMEEDGVSKFLKLDVKAMEAMLKKL